MNILVTGATGNVGRDLVDQLIAKGLRVRALTRNPDKANLPEQADVVSGDLGNSDALPALLAGIDKAFMLIGPDNGTEFAKAAAVARLRHVALLSSFTVTMDWPTTPNFIRVHHEVAEKSLIEAGVPCTFLRSSGFACNFLQWTCALRSQGVVRAPFANTALPLIHPHDIAAAASVVLTEPGHQGKAYTLTGPDALTTAQQTAIAADVLGIEARYEEISAAQATQILTNMSRLPERLAPQLLEVLGPAATALSVTGDVEQLTGRPALTFRQWVQDNLNRF